MSGRMVVWVLAVVVGGALVGGGCGGKASDDGDAAKDLAKAGLGDADLAGMTVVMIVGPKDFRDEELFEPKKLLEAAGATVTVACSSLDEATGMLGGTVKPDVMLGDIDVGDYDAVVFVGGSGAKVYWDDETAHAIAVETVELDKVLGAICLAPVTLANAGVLEKKKATVWKSEREQLDRGVAEYTGADVEVDGKIITANGPKAAKAFGEALVKALAAQRASEGGE